MLELFRQVLCELSIDRFALAEKLSTFEMSFDALMSMESDVEAYYAASPDACDGYAKLALICAILGDQSRALECWEKDYRSLKISWWHAVRYAEVLWRFDPGKAESIIESVYDSNQSAVNGFSSIAWANRDTEKDVVEALFQRDISMNRLSPGFRLNYACYKAETKNLSEAILQVEIAYSLDEKLRDGFSRLSSFLSCTNDRLRLFERDFELHRTSADNRIQYAKLLTRCGKCGQVLEALDGEFGAVSKDAYITLAFEYWQNSQDFLICDELFQRDYQAQNASSGNLLNYACLLVDANQSDRAEHLVAEVYATSPKAVNGYSRIAWHFFWQGGASEKVSSLFEKDVHECRMAEEGFVLNAAFLIITEQFFAAVSRLASFIFQHPVPGIFIQIIRVLEKNITYQVCMDLIGEEWRYYPETCVDFLVDLFKQRISPQLDVILSGFLKDGGCPENLMEVIPEMRRRVSVFQEQSLRDEEDLVSDSESPLFASDVQVRCAVAAGLATQFYESGLYDKALVYYDRAFRLSGYSDAYLDAYIFELKKQGDAKGLYASYVESGIRLLENGAVAAGLSRLNQAFYVKVELYGEDVLIHDPSLIRVVELEADKLRFPQRKVMAKRPFVVAYLFPNYDWSWGVNHAIVDILSNSGQPSSFVSKALFYKPVPQSPNSRQSKMLEMLNRAGIEIIAPDYGSDNPYLEAARKFNQAGCDVLATNYQNYEMLYTWTLAASPLLVHYIQGACAYAMTHQADHCMVWSKAVQKDVRNDSTFIPAFKSLISQRLEIISKDVVALSREDLGISDSAFTLVVLGRVEKFKKLDYWCSLVMFLNRNRDAYLVVAGFEKKSIGKIFVSSGAEAVADRIVFTGSIDNWRDVLRIGDVYVDSYPESGGATLFYSILLNLPSVSFSNDYKANFSAMNWSHADMLYPENPLLIRNRGDFGRMAELLQELKNSPAMRAEISVNMAKYIAEIAEPAGGSLRQVEQVYLNLLERSGAGIDNLGDQ